MGLKRILCKYCSVDDKHEVVTLSSILDTMFYLRYGTLLFILFIPFYYYIIHIILHGIKYTNHIISNGVDTRALILGLGSIESCFLILFLIAVIISEMYSYIENIPLMKCDRKQ